MGTFFAGDEPELLLLLLSPLVVTSDWAEECIEVWLLFVDGACPSSASFLRRFMTVGMNLVDKERSPGSCCLITDEREIIVEIKWITEEKVEIKMLDFLLIPLHCGILLKYLIAPTRLWKQGIRQKEHRAIEDFCHKRCRQEKTGWVEKSYVYEKSEWIQGQEYLKRVINSLNPRTTKARIAHGGGNQLLFRRLASWNSMWLYSDLKPLKFCKLLAYEPPNGKGD